MILSGEDKKESKVVSRLIKKIELIDQEYVKKESELIAQKQPFLISLILGYRLDLSELELEEMMKVVFLIWEFFKKHPQIEKTKISEPQYTRVQQRNIHMLKYFEGEKGQRAKLELVAADLGHMSAKSLFAGVLIQFDQKVALSNMESRTRGIILSGLKSLIECFEEIVYKK